jgi:hypothetical protein
LGKSQIKNAKFYRNVKTGWEKHDEKTLALPADLGHTFNAQIRKDSKL